MITAHPTAPLGSVVTLCTYSPSDFTKDPDGGQTIINQNAILCRNTAPLIAFAFNLLRHSVACHVVGRDIQVGLDKLIEKVGGDTIDQFRRNMGAHQANQTEKLRRKGKKEQAENYNDKCEALLVIARNCLNVADMKERLTAIFKNGDGLTLSTIHKAKGLEWETVFLLDWKLLPSSYAETAAAKQQERNLQYVAVTRAKLNLKFINSGNWKL